jgi:sensor histidine kinase YesM
MKSPGKKSYGIRERLINSFFMTAALMCVMMVYNFVGINSIAMSITSAYRTNVKLDEFGKALRDVEARMEDYISMRTFGSLQNYYSLRGKLDTLSAGFSVRLSSDQVQLLEFKVKKLMESFLEYSDKAVYARRGNNVQEYTANYESALRVYGYLSDSVNELNALYFQRNISGYNRLYFDLVVVEILSVLLLAVVMCVNFLMVYILIDRVTGPLVEISKAADEIASGNFDVEIRGLENHDEVGNICRAFDRMTVSIREYIETLRSKVMIENRLRQQEMEMRELYKDAQLKTLQAQINPHFLFNTLNAGAQLAMMEGADDTCTFIEKTAEFFRYNIQNMNKDTVLAGEIDLVDNYMYIMKVRFADRLSWVRDISCARLDVPMPSMILQPLVENSIKHGISEMKSGGAISLSVRDEGSGIIIEISDNGVGIDESEIDRLLKGQDASRPTDARADQLPSVGIGMVNVITRLRVFFDDPDIISIRRNDPEPGTTFSIRIRHV